MFDLRTTSPAGLRFQQVRTFGTKLQISGKPTIKKPRRIHQRYSGKHSIMLSYKQHNIMPVTSRISVCDSVSFGRRDERRGVSIMEHQGCFNNGTPLCVCECVVISIGGVSIMEHQGCFNNGTPLCATERWLERTYPATLGKCVSTTFPTFCFL